MMENEVLTLDSSVFNNAFKTCLIVTREYFTVG